MNCIPLLIIIICYCLYYQELLPGQPRPSLTSTTTQETTLEDSITSIIIQSNDTGGATIPIKTNNRVEYADITINNDDTTAPVNPPTGAQPVMYSEVAGDITKVFINLYNFFIIFFIILERSCHCIF